MDPEQRSSWRNFFGGFFSGAHHFTVYRPTMINMNDTRDKDSMELLAKNTIPGAEYDSSERYPPPSCHPGTRLSISDSIQTWMRNSAREKRLLWLYGSAGVGKSAIMQTLAESEADTSQSCLGATLFFSRTRKRDDPDHVFATIAYQLAVKYPPYRKYIVEILSNDTKIVRKSRVEQFKWFIVKPFVEKNIFQGFRETILIFLDGLDECKGEQAQSELILLIGRFSLQYPSTPLIWVIASRPETHIRATFLHPTVQESYMAVEVPIDSDEACADVERYLRHEFDEMRRKYSLYFSPSTQWPTETEFSIIAKAASGLFIFAATVVRFVDDVAYGNPVSQLRRVLDVISSVSLPTNFDNPFAVLDALYTEILSSVPRSVLPHTQNLFFFLLPEISNGFIIVCNLIGLTQADAYAALRKLYSVLQIPDPSDPFIVCLAVYHASFIDYLTTPSRSGPFWVDKSMVWEKYVSMSTRLLLELHNPADSSIHWSRIRLSWPTADPQDLQKSITGRSISGLLDLRPEAIDDTTRQAFIELAPLFGDLDFVKLEDVFDCYPGIALSKLCTSAFRPLLEEWKVIQTVPIDSLDLDRIRMDATASIVCFKETDFELDCMRPGMEWDEITDDYPSLYVGVSDFTDIGDWTDCESFDKTLPLGEDPQWKALVWRNLVEMIDIIPSYPIMVFGKGDKSCALIAAGTPGQFWIYYLPYNHPS